jgi:putative Holliday junction resolvase
VGGVLAIDYGERKTGFASADPTRIVLQPLETVRVPGAGTELLDHIQVLLAERDVSHLLVGMPLHADGTAGSQALRVEEFVERARERFPELTIVTHDEHLTTKEAESRLHEHGYRGKEIADRKDSWSALVLLEDWVRSGEPG